MRKVIKESKVLPADYELDGKAFRNIENCDDTNQSAKFNFMITVTSSIY